VKKFLLPALVFAFSCGGPEFSVSYRYIPPKGSEGKECLKSCKLEYSECESECLKKRSRCLLEAREKATKIYEKELSAYEKELRSYQNSYASYQRRLLDWNKNYRELYRDYLYFKDKCKRTKDYYACRRKNELEEALDSLSQIKPTPPEKPEKPTLSKIVKELSSTCYFDCGCKSAYEACFTSCGGELRPERICVKNCQ